jgi:hypothetical protein
LALIRLFFYQVSLVTHTELRSNRYYWSGHSERSEAE